MPSGVKYQKAKNRS